MCYLVVPVHMSTPVWQGPSLLHGFWTFSSVHYFWKCELHILRVCTAKVLNTIHTHQNPWLSHEVVTSFPPESRAFSQWVITLSSGQVSNGTWGLYDFEIGTPALPEEQMSLWAAIDFFWVHSQARHVLLFRPVFPTQYLCGHSRSGNYISLFYFMFICVFPLFLPVTVCVWSLSFSCLPSFVVISEFDRHGFYFIL